MHCCELVVVCGDHVLFVVEDYVEGEVWWGGCGGGVDVGVDWVVVDHVLGCVWVVDVFGVV